MGRIERRQFLIAAGTLLRAPLSARAPQPGRTYVVGTFISGLRREWDSYRAALRERLASHGFVEGRNLRFEDRLGLAAQSATQATRELVAMKVDAIFACHTTTTQGAQAATQSVPIVFTWVIDPVRLGMVRDLRHPGGNITGVTSRLDELVVKRLEIAHELVPGVKRVAAIGSGTGFMQISIRPRLLEAAKRLNVEVLELNLSPGAIDEARQGRAQAALTMWHHFSTGERHPMEALIRRSLKLHLPLIVAGAEEAEAGGLIAYGTDIIDDLRRAADMLARVLKGEKPEDMPVDQAARFQMVVNLKSAGMIGLAIPPSILLRADRVIE